MPRTICTETHLREALDALRAHGSTSAAARALGLPRTTLAWRLTLARQWAAGAGISVPPPSSAPVPQPPPSPRLPATADECWTLIDEWIGRKRMAPARARAWQPTREQRIAIAGDFHAPFHDPDVISTLIADEGPRTDTLVIAGDLMDFYSISRFLKYERVPIEQELAATEALLAHLASAFPDVVIVEGNHDAPRFEKQVRALLSPELMHCIDLLTGGNLSLVKLLAQRYPNVRFAPQSCGNHELGWLTQIGDLIVAHAEKFSRVPGSALRQIEEGMADFEHVYNLQPWRVLTQAHTHQFSMIPWHADKVLLESGCCCQTHGYQLTARMGGRPQRQGYLTLTQVDGKTDVNSIKFRWLNADRKAAA